MSARIRQARFHPLSLSRISGIFFLGCGLAACSHSNGNAVNLPASPSIISPRVLIATPILPQPTLLPFNPSPPTSTPIPATPTLSWPYSLPELDGEPLFSEFFTLLSPDGQWLVNARSVARNPSRMELISTSDPAIILFSSPVDEFSISPGSGVISWSPDSRAIVVESARIPAPCGYDRITIYQITDQLDVTYATYYLPDGENGCFSVAWSPDGSQLALFDGADSVTILNRQGQVVQQMTIPVRWGLFWTARGLFTEVRQEHGQPVHTELRLYDLATPDQFQTLLERDEYFLTMGFDEEFQRVLVASLPGQPTAEVQTYQLLIYDLKTGTSQTVAAIRGSIWFNRVSHLPPDKIVFLYDPSNGEAKRLMKFDWATMQVTDYGEIAFLIGWRPNVEGVLVVQSDNKDIYWIEVVPIEP
jgi:WD40 repeat protein